MLQGFFGNLIFAIIARMLCGNHLKHWKCRLVRSKKLFTILQEKHTESYRLILVGHSLGAGTAAILAMLLRPTYPDLFCYAFSPPGATLRYFLYIKFHEIPFTSLHRSCWFVIQGFHPQKKTTFRQRERSGNFNKALLTFCYECSNVTLTKLSTICTDLCGSSSDPLSMI